MQETRAPAYIYCLWGYIYMWDRGRKRERYVLKGDKRSGLFDGSGVHEELTFCGR